MRARVLCLSMLVSPGLTIAPASAQKTVGEPFAATMVANVARIRAGDRTGFGFVVGLGARQLLVATALHTIDGPGGEAPAVCFPHRGESCATGEVLLVADAIGTLPALDLAVLAVEYPDGLAWRPDVMAQRVEVGDAVFSIGRAAEWYIPEQPGHVAAVDTAKRLVRYTGLAVAEGVSGAPIVSVNGIIAMHVQSMGERGEAEGVALGAIRQRVEEQARARWILVPRADCRAQSTYAGLLAGRTITLHFDAGAPDAALDATGLLHCLGARVTLQPEWDSAEWPRASITYRSGDVRLMRTLQTVLSTFGRLEARLGQPASDIEVWIR